ncbi:MAG: NADP-dependent isocitrate dehydrogenase [Desulfomicrobium sp.]|nr:NADP-dependent isocitrate dehydrogenase [Desulfomicrobium sp.]
MKRVYFIEGDGIGREVWAAGRPVLDRAVELAYKDGRGFEWVELLAGKKAFAQTGSYLPEETLAALKTADLAMKGPLETPVGKGFRSLNVTLRQTLDLFACIRPIQYFKGIESPVKHPERVNMVVFRENTEDVYAGIEWQAGSAEAKKLIAFLRDEMGANVDEQSGIGIKPMTAKGSKRLIRKAIQFALDQNRTSVTMAHKGNIMKFTEGAFRNWGYELAAEEFSGVVVREGEACCPPGRVVLQDRIADAMFQEVLIRPEKYDVIATPNLNGDYLSDALAAQVGGLGLAPGVNMSSELAFFEPTHGTAPTIEGKDLANPGSLILSGALMLDHVGWHEAARKIRSAVELAIFERRVTVDLASQMANAKQVGCAEFGQTLLANLERV